MINSSYRPDIDGLRAWAVAIVILFHLNPDLLPGGYLGVDIFFVISGYVITQSLVKKYEKDGEIRLIQFYVRRIKRLYPALVAMILVTSVAYLFIGFHWDTNLYIKSAISSLFAFSNLYFLYRGDEYFHQDLINPLLHTWSLGIEEQFYLFYPVLLSLLLVWQLRLNVYRRFVFLTLVFLTTASFLIFAFGTGLYSEYYAPTARFWELGIGCALYFLISVNCGEKINKYVGLSSFVALVFIVMLVPRISMIPIETLVAAVATAGIIFAGNSHKGFLQKLLSQKWIVYLGLISYSLYLWHLPVIYFSNLYFDGLLYYYFSILGTFCLAAFFYHYIENPLRHNASFGSYLQRAVKCIPGVIILMVIGTISLVYSSGISSVRTEVNAALEEFADKIKRFNYIENSTNLGSRIQSDYTPINCNFLSELQPVTYYAECSEESKGQRNKNLIYLTGDSHARHFVPMFDDIEFELDRYFVPLEASIFESWNQTSRQMTQKRSLEISSLYKKYDRIFYVNSYFLNRPKYNSENLADNMRSYIEQFESSVRIIFIATTPVAEASPQSCVLLNSHCLISHENVHNEVLESTNAILQQIADDYENVYLYDPNILICPEVNCKIYRSDEDLLVYMDDDHLSIEFTKSLSNNFTEWFLSTFDQKEADQPEVAAQLRENADRLEEKNMAETSGAVAGVLIQ